MFALLAVACAAAALGLWDRAGWYAAPLLYPASSFALLVVAYAGAGPGLLLKRPTGCRPIWGWSMFGPYLVLSVFSFVLYRWTSREPASVTIAPNVSFGRRLTASESAAGGWVSVLDLAAEFTEVRPLRELPGYRSMPVLDATAPTEAQLCEAVAWIIASALAGPVYVHCALGFGRSACTILAYLLAVGEVKSVGEGVRRLRALRPGVRLNSAQRRILRAFEPPTV